MKLQVINRHDTDKDSGCRLGKAQRAHADDGEKLDKTIRSR